MASAIARGLTTVLDGLLSVPLGSLAVLRLVSLRRVRASRGLPGALLERLDVLVSGVRDGFLLTRNDWHGAVAHHVPYRHLSGAS